MTNPTLLLAGANKPQYAHLIDIAIKYGKKGLHDQACLAMDRLLVEFGKFKETQRRARFSAGARTQYSIPLDLRVHGSTDDNCWTQDPRDHIFMERKTLSLYLCPKLIVMEATLSWLDAYQCTWYYNGGCDISMLLSRIRGCMFLQGSTSSRAFNQFPLSHAVVTYGRKYIPLSVHSCSNATARTENEQELGFKLRLRPNGLPPTILKVRPDPRTCCRKGRGLVSLS
ncbi:hypothetical protein V8E55_005819 [Tylopilus felleus]